MVWYDSSACCRKAEEMWSNLLYGGRNLICEHCFEQMKAWDCACLGQISFEGLFCSLTCSEIYFFNVTWSEVFFLLSLEIVLSCILLILKEMVLLLSSEILGLCFK